MNLVQCSKPTQSKNPPLLFCTILTNVSRTEKADRMFGIIALCLPCKHEGGEVVVSFNGKRETLSTAATSEWLVSYLGWYADVTHEVRPVISGYRIVLTFNLVQNGPAIRSSLADHDGLTASLQSTMLRWTNTGARSYVICLLHHKYTDASLSLDRLKGRDRSRVQSAATFAEKCDFICCLASVEKFVYGGVEDEDSCSEASIHDILDVCDYRLHLKRVVDLDGNKILEDVPVEERNFVQSEPFHRRPDEAD